jgi:oligopeptide transport system substrate-binding protein
VFPANLLDDIAGARDYRLGKLDDPDKIGVRALDDTTLEVQLEKPVAYFPYLLWLPVTFPLPSKVIEHWGTDWWKPEHIVSNGPYQLVRYEPGGGFELVRNPLYRGEFLGNVNRIKFNHQSNLNARIASFRSKQLDMTWVWKDSMEDNLQQYAPDTLNELSNVVAVFPNQPPITDTRVRQAFAYAFGDVGGRDQGSSGSGLGGILPRGLPGHSPGLGFPYNPEQARKILAEAGYPEGKGFPTLEVGIGTELDFETFKDPVEKMATLLGIEVNFQSITYPFIDQGNFHLYLVGWILDYPDPDSVMRVGAFREILRRSGWDIADYDRLVEQAASTQDRSLRMDLYRRADYILVNEHVYIVPIDNGERRPINQITQSWVKGVKNYPIGGWIPFKYLTIDEEERRKEKKG